jgi:hypothetical protein
MANALLAGMVFPMAASATADGRASFATDVSRCGIPKAVATSTVSHGTLAKIMEDAQTWVSAYATLDGAYPEMDLVGIAQRTTIPIANAPSIVAITTASGRRNAMTKACVRVCRGVTRNHAH